MGAIEDAVDSAAKFMSPYIDRRGHHVSDFDTEVFKANNIVDTALAHLQAINVAKSAADPSSPLDVSLTSVVYELLDLIASIGVLPNLSPGVVFSQRPKSVLKQSVYNITPPTKSVKRLSDIILSLAALLQKKESSVQPLLSQRILPDVVSGLMELSFNPGSNENSQSQFSQIFRNTISETPTARLLPMLTTYLQQSLPGWLKPIISEELSLVPLRQQGIRHTLEFLAMSYLAKNSGLPRQAPVPQIPMPLEVVNQASRLLVLPPGTYSQADWLCKLAPQLLWLLDGNGGKELSRAAGVIITRGILCKRKIGAPGAIGWELFARPLLQIIFPNDAKGATSQEGVKGEIVVSDRDLNVALERLSTIATAHSHTGLVRRLIGPLLLPLWALLNYAHAHRSIDRRWFLLPQSILSQYFTTACDVKQFDNIARNLFWDGTTEWTLGPGSGGGIEMRRRHETVGGTFAMDNIFSRIEEMDHRIDLLLSLFVDTNVSDDIVGSIFIQATGRWLNLTQYTYIPLMEPDGSPLAALIDAKLSARLAAKFKDNFARSPQHIIELMGQLIANFAGKHRSNPAKSRDSGMISRAVLSSIANRGSGLRMGSEEDCSDTGDEDDGLVLFALSIISTTVTSASFIQTPKTKNALHAMVPELKYLAQSAQTVLSPLIKNAAFALLEHVNPPSSDSALDSNATIDQHGVHRVTLASIMSGLTSTEPPDRTWAVHTLHSMVKDPIAFTIIDVPSTTHILLSASLADPESYVHVATVPVLVDLAIRVPNPVIKILVEAYIDIDEQSLQLEKPLSFEEKERELGRALDFRLRIGEVLNQIVLDDVIWDQTKHPDTGFKYARQILDACLLIAGRRGQRTKTMSSRAELEAEERQLRDDGEAAWGGPIPNMYDSEVANVSDKHDKAEYEELSKILHGWQRTGIEEDVRIRASALSIVSTMLEHRLRLLEQSMLDTSLQVAFLVLTLETSDAKAILRRAGTVLVLSLLRALEAALENGHNFAVGMNMKQEEELERVIVWLQHEDKDTLVRDHAAAIMESLETLKMKQLYRIKDNGSRSLPSLSFESALRGIRLTPSRAGHEEKRHKLVEEVE